MIENSKDLAVQGTGIIETLASQMGIALPGNDWRRPDFVGTDFKNEFLAGFDEETYHDDRSAVSRSDILAYLKSPAHFVALRQQERKKDDDKKFRFGRLVHSLFLETDKFKEKYLLIPEFTGLTKDGRPSTRSGEAQEKKKAFFDNLPSDAIACTREELIELFGMAQSISQNDDACNLLFGAKMEMTGYFRDPVTGLKVRIRVDFLNDELSALGDLKSALSASKDDFSSSLSNYRYDIQLALYGFGHEVIRGNSPRFKPFIVMEKGRPYSTQVYTPAENAIKKGMTDVRFALDGIAKSLQENHFPHYFSGPQDVDHAHWFYKK